MKGVVMEWLNSFQSELISQTSITHYVEYCFEREYNAVGHLLKIKIDLDTIYNDNAAIMSKLANACDAVLEENGKSYVQTDALPKWIKESYRDDTLNEVLDYCIEELKSDLPLQAEELKKELDNINLENGENIYDFSEEQLKDIIKAAHILMLEQQNGEMEENDDKINAFKITIKLVDVSSSSNIFRQSFINIFSIFDAYVFDFLKQYFRQRPEELDCFFECKGNERAKITFNDVLPFATIDDLKNDLINRQFEGKYLSEIIRKLKKYKPALFGNLDYLDLMEMIERRNVHLHNKGIVDEHYKNNYNKYNFDLGDYAYIDSEYLFIKVFNTLSAFVTNLDSLL